MAAYYMEMKASPINADLLRARAVNLRHGFHAFGAVNLRGAEIANNLELDGGRIANPTGVALSLNAARIGGVVFLRNGFTAQGEVNLAGAYIGLGLDCSGARFDGGGTSAFTANDSKIGRKVDFSGRDALGQVSLVATEIGSDLSIDRADFRSATLSHRTSADKRRDFRTKHAIWHGGIHGS